MRRKAYLAGPMRTKPDFNFPAFDAGAKYLRSLGFEVFSPAERDREIGFDPTGLSGSDLDLQIANFSVREALAVDLSWICREADLVVLLPGWQDSAGVAAEMSAARAIGIPVVGLREIKENEIWWI